MLDDAGQAAVLRQPFQRRFRAALGHARHIVDRVADQGQVIDDAVRRHAELGQHAGFVEFFIVHRIDQRDLGVDQLGQVLVAGRDHGVHASRSSLYDERADHVVRLDPFDHQDRPTHRPHRLMDRCDLTRQVFRHRGALCLVFGIQVVAESLALGVEHAGDIGGRIVSPQAAQHVDHAVDGAGGHAVRAAQVGQRMESAIEVTGTVNEQQGFLHDAK